MSFWDSVGNRLRLDRRNFWGSFGIFMRALFLAGLGFAASCRQPGFQFIDEAVARSGWKIALFARLAQKALAAERHPPEVE